MIISSLPSIMSRARFAWILEIIIICSVLLKHVACGHPSGESFEFIVVGGGIAGCTVCGKIAQTGRFSVLLLEAGGYPHEGLEVPGVTELFMENGVNFRQYPSVGVRNVSYGTGWGLGGGSSINGFVFNRGSPHDWDNWANLTKDSGWRYENMMKYFKRVETYKGDFPSDQHGYSGPITVSRPKYSPGMETILHAGSYLGYPIADQNGPQQVSFTPLEYSKKRGRRVSSFTGYLKPLLGKRRNLKVVTGAKVERIVFQEEETRGKRVLKAVGVLYSENGGITRFARSTKEIIISAGVIESPVLLLKSGVGPKDTLAEVGIPLVKDLPVGKNLHDHALLRIQFIINDTSQVLIPERDRTPENYRIYNITGDGPYSTHDADNAQAFLASTQAQKSVFPDWADLQIQFVSSGGSAPPPPEDILPGETTVSGMLYLTRPKSRGVLTLNISSGEPILDFQYFQHPQDLERMLDGIQRTLQIYEETPSFQKIGARYSSVPLRHCKKHLFRSRAYWKCFLMQNFESGYHGGGSCSMGSGKTAKNGINNNAVVDSSLKVIGIEGLRVVDSSVMPQVINANTQAAVYAIAEKAVDMILQRWQGGGGNK